jgi:hypothetical protein
MAEDLDFTQQEEASLLLVAQVTHFVRGLPVRATVGSEVGDLSEHVGSSEVTLT